MTKYVFVDTMIFLHYKPIDEIDFPGILGVDKVDILISRIMLRELDEQKNTNKLNRIRERAKKVLLKLENWMQRAETIRPGVNIAYYGSTPKIDFEKHGLNPNWNDDFLLATILQYNEDYPGVDVCLITQDSGPRLTAQHLSIPAFELSGELMLPVQLDPIEQENQELRKTLAKLQSALPQLIVCFAETEPPEVYAKFLLQAPQIKMG
jgi:predicted ribonuclease YlaK